MTYQIKRRVSKASSLVNQVTMSSFLMAGSSKRYGRCEYATASVTMSETDTEVELAVRQDYILNASNFDSDGKTTDCEALSMGKQLLLGVGSKFIREQKHQGAVLAFCITESSKRMKIPTC